MLESLPEVLQLGIAPRAIFELGSTEIGSKYPGYSVAYFSIASSKSHPDLRAESLAIYVRRCKFNPKPLRVKKLSFWCAT